VAAPACSVVIPARDAAPFLGRCLGSALGQTLRDIEVIVVDDGSTDATPALLADWAARDPRLVVLRQPGQGVSAARNRALDAARGRWIALLDADDAFEAGRLRHLLARAEAEQADLMADNPLLEEFGTGRFLGTAWPGMDFAALARAPLTPAGLLLGDRLDLPGYAKTGYLKPVLRRDFLLRHGLRYREGLPLGEDFLFYFECVAAGGRFLLDPSAGYRYAIRPGSASAGRHGALWHSASLRPMRQVAASLPPGPETARLHDLLRQRQRVADGASFELALEARRFADAARYAWTADPRAVRRRLGQAARRVTRRLAGR
jgi:glycosyltransferase involved in cell wall biosynthesis